MNGDSLPFHSDRSAENERLTIALQAAGIGTWEFFSKTRTVRWDERCRNLYGFQGEDLVSLTTVLALLHPDDRPLVEQAVDWALTPGSGGEYDVRFRTRGAQDGQLRWLHCKGRAFFDAQQTVTRFSGIAQDVTAQVLQQQQLETSLRLNKLATDGAGVGAFHWYEQEGRLVYDARLVRIMTGEVIMNLDRQSLINFIHPDDQPIREEAYRQGKETGRVDYEVRFVWTDGSVHWVRLVGQYYADENGIRQDFTGIAQDVTSAATARRQLEASEQRFRRLVEQAPVATCVLLGEDLLIDIANQMMLEIWGRGNDVLGKPLGRALPELGEQPHLALLQQVLRTGKACENRAGHSELIKQGRRHTYYFDYTYKPLRDATGRIYGVIAMAVDVTRQVLAQQQKEAAQKALRQSEERFRLLVTASSDTVYSMSSDWSHLVWLKGKVRPTEVPAVRRDWMQQLVPVHEQARLNAAIDKAIASRNVFELEHQLYRRDGSLSWVFSRAIPVEDEEGRLVEWFGATSDVTDRYLIRQRIEDSQRQLLALFEQSPVGIAILHGPALTFQMANPFYARLVGRRPADLVGKGLLEAVPELTGQGFDRLLQNVLETGKPFAAEEIPVEIVRENGLETIYVDFLYQPRQGVETDLFTDVLVIATDVTVQVRNRKAVELSEARLRSIIASAPAAMGLFVGRDLVVEMPNQAFIDIVGKGPDIVGKPLRDVMPELLTENQPYLQILDEVYTTGKTFRTFGSPVSIVQNGVLNHNFYNFTYSPLLDERGEVYAILDIAIDVTEQMKARRQVEESEARYRQLSGELESRVLERTCELQTANQDLQRSNQSLEQFAYIASHDLQEPLRKIQAFSTMLQTESGALLGEQGLDRLRRISTAGAHMSNLIKSLLTYSRVSARQEVFEPVSLDAILASTLNTLDWEITQRQARIYGTSLPVVRGDEMQLGQLFQNLLTNALKFTPNEQQPDIEISCTRLKRSELPPGVQPTSPGTAFYCITFRDQGIGFDPRYIDRIFEVFQRLHGHREFPGTGIGLAICQRVVLNHGGAITATGQPGRGATFQLYLPA